VLALQGTLAAAASAWLWWRLRGVVPPPAGSRHNWWTSAWHSLRGGRALFAFRALGTVYQHGALLLLGVLAPAGAVAAYGAADRLVRAGLNLLEPVSRAVVPRVARLQVAGGGAWEGMVRMLLVWLGGGALLCCFVLFLGAELVVRVVLGDGYQAAVPVLRVLAIMLPLVAVATVLGFFWALPAGRDGVLLRGTALAGAVNLALVAGLVPRYEAIGMGVAVVAAEGVMVGVLARAYRGRG
jgi:PST family polysaccharide transporter